MTQLHLHTSFYRAGIEESSAISPLKISGGIFLSYTILFTLYIWISGSIAKEFSATIAELYYFELLKGWAFIFITGLALAFASYRIFSRLREKDDELISQSKAAIISERQALIGTFASSVSHDINNLVQILIYRSEKLGSCLAATPYNSMMVDIQGALARIASLAKGMMISGKSLVSTQKEKTDLPKLIWDIVEFAQSHRKVKGVKIRLSMPVALIADVNSVVFQRALINMILNSAEATDSKGSIEITLSATAEAFSLSVDDNGPGIPDELRERVFEPFFTTKGEGNGLGLISLKLLLQEHGGTLEICRSLSGGASFRFSFPLEQAVAGETPT